MFPELAKKPYALTGYDQNYVLFESAARDGIGRNSVRREIWNPDEALHDPAGSPVLHGRSLPGTLLAKGRTVFLRRRDFQTLPTMLGFPSALLRPGETYWQRTLYAFERVAGY